MKWFFQLLHPLAMAKLVEPSGTIEQIMQVLCAYLLQILARSTCGAGSDPAQNVPLGLWMCAAS